MMAVFVHVCVATYLSLWNARTRASCISLERRPHQGQHRMMHRVTGLWPRFCIVEQIVAVIKPADLLVASLVLIQTGFNLLWAATRPA